jgi:hypothetical protein
MGNTTLIKKSIEPNVDVQDKANEKIRRPTLILFPAGIVFGSVIIVAGDDDRLSE